MSKAVVLYSYWRSSAAYRVRIALNLKEIPYEQRHVHLLKGDQHDPEYRKLNPQELVPALIHGEHCLTQSMAIIEYLDEAWSATSPLLPMDLIQRARVRAIAAALACEAHAVNNSRVLQYLSKDLQVPEEQKLAWIRHWIGLTLAALEQPVDEPGADSAYCVGGGISMAECFLVPQLYSARRFGVDLSNYPKLVSIDAKCNELEAFRAAHPERQLDAPTDNA